MTEYLFQRDGDQIRTIASDQTSTHEDMRAFKLSACRDCHIYAPHDCNFGIFRGASAQSALTGTRFAGLVLGQ